MSNMMHEGHRKKSVRDRTIALAIILAITVLLILFLTACDNKGSSGAEKTSFPAETTANASDAGQTSLSVIRDNWAWGIPDDKGIMLTAESYSSPNSWKNLTMALCPSGVIRVKYIGEKKATDNHSMGDGYYFPFFEDISGPVWEVIDKTVPAIEWTVLLLPESCRAGLISFTVPQVESEYVNGLYNHGYPPGPVEDIEKVTAMYKGRKIMHSELLAQDDDGGRVVLFQFVNTDEGLTVLAYINDSIITVIEFTAYVYEGGAYWRADLEDDDVGYFEVNMLCRTDQGLVMAFAWIAPEGSGKYLLVEKDGQFIDFIEGGWYYDWDGGFVK